MINLGKRTGFGFLFLILVLYTNQIFGQISSAALLLVDTAGLGDPISVDIKIVFPLNLDIKTIDFSDYKRILNKAYTQDSMTMEEYADLEVLDFGEWKYEALDIPVGVDKLKFTLENGKNVIFNTIKIAIYNIGVFAVPAPKVILGDTSVSIIHGQSSVIQITLPEKLMKQDTVVFNPIKDIIREDANFSDYLNYVYLLLGLLLIAGIGYYFYRLKKLKNELKTS